MDKVAAVEDARKKRQTKRDCAEVVEHPANEEHVVKEKTKKLRKEDKNSNRSSITAGTAAAAAATETAATIARTSETNRPTETRKPTDNHKNKQLSEKDNISEADPTLLVANSSNNTDETKTKLPRKEGRSEEGLSQPSSSAKVASTATASTLEAEPVADLESALILLVGINEGQIEKISDCAFLTFRLGTPVDASMLANLYRLERQQTPKNGTTKEASHLLKNKSSVSNINDDVKEENDNQESLDESEVKEAPAEVEENSPGISCKGSAETSHLSSSPATTPREDTTSHSEQEEAASALEIWLAEGLGEDDTPPSLFALLAHVNFDKNEKGEDNDTNNSKTSQLAAVALLTLAWENSTRILRVEWFFVNSKELENLSGVVERRMWLRLSSLSLMTACEMLVVDQSSTLQN